MKLKALLRVSAAIVLLLPAVANAQDNQVEEIVVTAERTNRALRDTATSVAVQTGEDIDNLAGTDSTYDLIERIPGLVATRQANNAPAVRGIDGGGPALGGNAFFGGTRPRLNFLVDGRTLTFNEAVYLDGGLWDTQQVEVYRGPQSTLQGRNAIGGVIAIKTADPTYHWTGRARLVVGEYDARQASAAIGGPILGHSLAFRVAADYREEDSYVKFAGFPGVDDPGHSRAWTLRGKLLITPEEAPDFRTLLTLSYTDAYAPQVVSVRQPFADDMASTADMPRFRSRATVGIADSSWKIADGITLTSFITATDFRIDRYAPVRTGIATIDGKEYSIEPRIRIGDSADRLSGFLALYWFKAKQREFIDFIADNRYHDETLTRAVFGEVHYKPVDVVEVTLAARYEKEERDRTGGSLFVIDFHKDFEAFLPRATVTVHTSPGVTLGATVGKGYNSGGAGFAFNPPFPSYIYDKETVWNYELFARTSLLGGRLRLNGNIFYNDYAGLQLPFDVAQNPAAPAIVIRNAEKATTYGAEIEARFKASPAVDLFASAGLLKTNIDRYADPSIQGRDLPRSPAFSASAGVTARPIRGADISFDVRYTDAYYSDAFNNARGKTDPYAIANAQIGYRVGPARLFVAATNLFDSREPILITPGPIAAADVANVNAPRKVTGGVELRF